MLSIGTGWAFIFDGLTFAGSAVSIFLMHARKTPDEGAHEALIPQIREGIAYVPERDVDLGGTRHRDGEPVLRVGAVGDPDART